MAQPLTSVVHEYLILYSSRILQKDKRWSDGKLRYYEFNQKIEVCSEELFIVATDFYPPSRKLPLESGAFEEGKQYQLPSGRLLVEFEEYLGCYMRDVTRAFSKTPERQQNLLPLPEGYVKLEQDSSSVFSNDKKVTRVKQEPLLGLQKPLKPRRVGLTRKIKPGPAKKQSDVTLFARRLTPGEKLEMFSKKQAPMVIKRIAPRSNHLYTRLYKELGIGEETEHATRVRTPEIDSDPPQSQEESFRVDLLPI